MLYGSSRLNSRGVNLPDPFECDPFLAGVARATRERWTGGALVSGKLRQGRATEVRNPANRSEIIGTVIDADEAAIEAAFAAAVRAQPDWDTTPATERAEVLERAADLFETRARRRPHDSRQHLGSTRGHRLPALLRGSRACRVRPGSAFAGSDRREQ
jgi:RHH-type proline utilization regulon transcriptional repressor/proline dehydrogenase/delta 1-pyrroline-5-carboxylate dehydrogenase